MKLQIKRAGGDSDTWLDPEKDAWNESFSYWVRRKPEFVPGYYRLKNYAGATVWWMERDPAEGSTFDYERVEVSSVEP